MPLEIYAIEQSIKGKEENNDSILVRAETALVEFTSDTSKKLFSCPRKSPTSLYNCSQTE